MRRLGATLLCAFAAACADRAAVEEALRSDDHQLRFRALYTLAAGGASSDWAAPQVAALVGSEHADTRFLAAWTLSAITTDRTHALPALRAALDDEIPQVRSAAAWSLGVFGTDDPAILAKIESMRAEADVWARQTARAAWKRLR